MKCRRLAGALGAEVSGIDLATAGANTALHDEVCELLFEHQVLVFPAQPIEATAFEAFARGFGELLDHPAYPKVEKTEVQILESTAETPSKIEAWHSDMTFSRTPPAFTVLQGKVIPSYGGDTLFSSAAAAFDALSSSMQGLVSQLSATHDFAHGFQESLAEPGGRERLAGAIAQNPPVTHPLVRKHRVSGRRALYVNPLFTTRIPELAADESASLLAFLFRHTVRDEFCYRVSWQPDTVVIWDNAVTQHKPVNDFFPQHRKLHRLTVIGDVPVGASYE